MNLATRAKSVWLVLVLLPLGVDAQQVNDDAFRYQNARPAFAVGVGPVVCIDEGHFNFHTADGRYRSFAELLRADGYIVKGYDGGLTRDALRDCDLLVVANVK